MPRGVGLGADPDQAGRSTRRKERQEAFSRARRASCAASGPFPGGRKSGINHLTSPSVRIPSSALFLVAAAFASDLFPSIGPSISAVEVVVTVALVVILFDGGASIGWRRFRAAAVPIVSLGILGTFATAGLITVFVHAVLGLGWLTAGLLGAAIAPTDPAVVFSVLRGGHEIRGRTRTILEGESGAN